MNSLRLQHHWSYRGGGSQSSARQPLLSSYKCIHLPLCISSCKACLSSCFCTVVIRGYRMGITKSCLKVSQSSISSNRRGVSLGGRWNIGYLFLYGGCWPFLSSPYHLLRSAESIGVSISKASAVCVDEVRDEKAINKAVYGLRPYFGKLENGVVYVDDSVHENYRMNRSIRCIGGAGCYFRFLGSL